MHNLNADGGETFVCTGYQMVYRYGVCTPRLSGSCPRFGACGIVSSSMRRDG